MRSWSVGVVRTRKGEDKRKRASEPVERSAVLKSYDCQVDNKNCCQARTDCTLKQMNRTEQLDDDHELSDVKYSSKHQSKQQSKSKK